MQKVLPVTLVVVGLVVGFAVGRWTAPTLESELADKLSDLEQAWVDAMKSDLLNLRTVQEVYSMDHGPYARSVSDLDGYTTTRGVSVTIEEGGREGWRATTRVAQVAITCWMEVRAGSVMEAEPECGS